MKKWKVYLSEYIDPEARRKLKAECDLIDSFDHPEFLDGIFIRRIPVPAELIRRAKRLKVIAVHGVGTDGIAMEQARKQNVTVVTVPGKNAQSVAELAIAFMLALSHRIKYVEKGLQNGHFVRHEMEALVGNELFHKKVGLLGCGNIGKRVGSILQTAFSCEICYYNRGKFQKDAEELGFRRVVSLEELFASAEYVNVSVPLTPETRGLIDDKLLCRSNPRLILVNTSRGGIVDEQALYRALVQKRIRGAASDVFEIEPPRPDNPLLALDNFIGTFHIGSNTAEALNRLGMATAEGLLKALHEREK